MRLLALSLFIALILIAALTSQAPQARAQEATIEITTSSKFDNSFFGEAVMQVIVNDQDAKEGSNIEQLTVSIEAEPDSGSGGSISITVPETSSSSGRFEFFLAHESAVAVGPGDLDPINSRGVEGDGACVADCAPFVTFGPGGDIAVDASLYEETEFKVSEGSAEIAVDYKEIHGSAGLDKDAYGTNSFVYISIIDQDANLNPTGRDEFAVDPDSTPNDDLLKLDGGSFEGAAMFEETGDNTGVFKGRYELGSSIEVSTTSVVLTLFEKANYGEDLDAPENDSTITDEVSFTIGNTDGSITVGGGQQPAAATTYDPLLASDKDAYAPGESIIVTVTDPDANANPNAIDYLQLEASFGSGQKQAIGATETGASTGVFEATFQLPPESDDADYTAAIIRYTDSRPADYSDKISSGEDPEKEFFLNISVVAGSAGGDAVVTTSVHGGAGPHVAGTQLTLATSISNNNNNVQQPFVLLVEVRDATKGVTVFLAWQGGTLSPGGAINIEMPWQPEDQGSYQLRAFAISDIAKGKILSPLSTSEVTII